jgi:PAS domain S-box-containing protein
MTIPDTGLLLPEDKPFLINYRTLEILIEVTTPWTVSVIVTDLEGTVTHWNRYAEVIYGWSATEAVGTPIADLTVGPVTQGTAEAIMDRLREGKHWSGAFEARRRDGDLITIQVVNAPVVDDDGNPVAIVGISREATDQLQRSLVELAEMRDLAGRLDEVRRTEARRISAQIHDEFSQRFHVLIQRTAALAANDSLASDHRDELLELLSLQQELVGVMHGVCGALRPPLLDELGAAVALDHMVESFNQLGLEVSASIDVALDSVDPAVGEVVLAIVQEALANVVAHADASTCDVSVSIDNDVIDLRIVDDGIGYGEKRGFGLRLMTERARRCGGTLSITAPKAGGTAIKARLPVVFDAGDG